MNLNCQPTLTRSACGVPSGLRTAHGLPRALLATVSANFLKQESQHARLRVQLNDQPAVTGGDENASLFRHCKKVYLEV